MKVSYSWIKEYFASEIPEPKEIAELLTDHAFEVESIEQVDDDFVIDIKVLPDRSHDCLSHIGIAKEVSLLTGIPLKKIDDSSVYDFPESNVLKIDIESQKNCLRFSTLVIENIKVKESPLWLKNRLETIGQRSINNVVDATNYVMFCLGQPLHAYDMDKLTNIEGVYKLSARFANEGEIVRALDDKEYILTSEYLVIADKNSNKALGIAGVKGGKASEISENTKHIILEAANFDPIAIRRTAKNLGLRTDASVRFENAITPDLTMESLRLVSKIILDVAKTDLTQVEGYCDLYPRKANSYKVGVSLGEIKRVLGLAIKAEEVEEILNRRGYAWKKINSRDAIIDLAPQYIGVPYKHGSSVVYDAPQSFDCSSFTSFLHAQSGIAIPRIAIDQYVFGEVIDEKDAIPGDLVFSNTKEEIFKDKTFFSQVLGKLVDHKPIRTESVEFMPGTQVPEGIDHVGVYIGEGKVIHATNKGGVVKEELKEAQCFKNIIGYRRFINDNERYVITIPSERLDLRIKEDLIEEIGRIHGYSDLESKPIDIKAVVPVVNRKTYYEDLLRNFLIERGFSEVRTYAFRDIGEVEIQNPIAQDKKYLRTNLTDSIRESALKNIRNTELLGLEQVKIFEFGKVFRLDDSNLEYESFVFAIQNTRDWKGQSVVDEANTIISSMENLLGVNINFKEVDGIYEANFSKIIEKANEPNNFPIYIGGNKLRYTNFSQYPFVIRDIAVFVPVENDGGKIVEIARKEADGLLVQSRLLENNFTKEFPDGKKTSHAYRLIFQSNEKTLTDDEVNVIMDSITKSLNSINGWKVR